MTSLIIDLIALTLIIIVIIISARKGFLSGVVSFVGWLASAFVANFLCTFIADYIYANIIKDKIYTAVLNSLSDQTASLSSSYADLINSLPQAIQGLLNSADLSALDSVFADPSRSPETVALRLSEDVIGPVVTTLLTALAFIVVFFICLFIVRLLSGLFKGVRKIPIIGPVNTLLGGLIGVVEAIIILYAFKMIVEFVITAAGGNLFGITLNDFADSYIFQILNFNFRGLL